MYGARVRPVLPPHRAARQRNWWAVYDDLPTDVDAWIQSWDLSVKGGLEHDYVVGLVAAGRGADIYLVDRVKAQLSFPEPLAAIRRTCRQYPSARTILVEDTANGPAVIATLRHEIPVVALGVGADGTKHALGLWEGSTENATVCQSLLANLQSRGLRTDRSVLVMLDGSKALRAAVTAVFGRAAVVQRCQVHKTRNILDHLPARQRPWVQAILRRAYQHEDVKTAMRLLRNLARRLDREHPCAAASVREGLEETVTVLTLGLAPRLQRSLATTNAAESLISRTRHVKRNVKRWRGGQMMLRWVAAGVLEAAKGFRRLKGHADMPQFVAALRARDHRLGLGDSREAQHVA